MHARTHSRVYNRTDRHSVSHLHESIYPDRSGSFVLYNPDLSLQQTDMADKTPNKPTEASYAKRLDPTSEELSREQIHFIRQVELAQWKKKTQKLRARNVATGLAIGAVVVGIYGYTFYSVSQEKIMDELDQEAKAARRTGPTSGPTSGAN